MVTSAYTSIPQSVINQLKLMNGIKKETVLLCCFFKLLSSAHQQNRLAVFRSIQAVIRKKEKPYSPKK